MHKLTDILTFKTLLAPVLLQVLFWAGMVGNFYGSWWLYSHGNWAWIVSLVFGSLAIRIIFESLMLRFRSYEVLLEIRANLATTGSISPGTDGD